MITSISQIKTIFSHSKLLIAVARHNLEWLNNFNLKVQSSWGWKIHEKIVIFTYASRTGGTWESKGTITSVVGGCGGLTANGRIRARWGTARVWKKTFHKYINAHSADHDNCRFLICLICRPKSLFLEIKCVSNHEYSQMVNKYK